MTDTSRNARLHRRLEGIALILIAVSAILFQRAATSSWFEARANGHRFLVSPIGVQDWGVDSADRPAAECRWWPKLGNAELCALAPGGESAMAGLRRVYPLIVVSLWTAVLALFLVAIRIPRVPRAIGVIAATVVPVLALAALYSLATSATRALSVLSTSSLTLEPRTFAGVLGGAILASIAVALLLKSGSHQNAHATRSDVAVPLRDKRRAGSAK